MHGHAWQSPGIRLHTIYALTPTDEGTRLDERVRIRAPFGMKSFVRSQAASSHRTTLQKMKALLEGGA